MKQFFKMVFSSMIGFLAAGILLMLIGVAVVAALVKSIKTETEVAVEPNSYVYLTLSGDIKERTEYESSGLNLLNGQGATKHLGLLDMQKNIRKAALDKNIKGLVLDARFFTAGWATTEALRNELIAFKKSKKQLYAYSEIMTQKAYYLCSVADHIYLNPQGVLEFSGLSVNIMFLKGTLDKLGIEPQIFYCGKYKSATEPLRYTKMSEPNRLQTTVFIKGMFHHMLEGIAKERSISVAQLDSISNNLLVRTASDALRYKMIDKAVYYDELLEELKQKTGADKIKNQLVMLADYDGVDVKEATEKYTKNKVAVLFAEGEIVDGRGSENSIGSEKYAAIIRSIREDEHVKALVVRVNSPGGSALASDIIWRELQLTKKKMPVVVSMGDYAASGGYYISCMADTIFAQPNTLTGSIGVFGILPCMEKFLTDKLGITYDGVKTGKFSDMPTISRALTPEEKVIIQGGVDTIYQSFLARVAQGRKHSKAEIDTIAQGRVWSGEIAIEKGLVDRLGGLDNAIACARRMTKTSDLSIVSYPKQDNSLARMLYQLTEDQKETMLKAELGDFFVIYRQLMWVKKQTGVQARIPFEMEIR